MQTQDCVCLKCITVNAIKFDCLRIHAYMFANWGKYQRHCKWADADLLPQINNASDAAGLLYPATFMGHKEHLNLYTHVETLML